MAAVCEREREHMPVVGISKDRQVLRLLNGILSGVRSMMCFGCAQIQAHVPLWEKMYEPGQHGGHVYHAKQRGSRQSSVAATAEVVEESTWNEHHQASHVSQSMIQMYSIEDSLERFYNRNNDSFRQHFNWEAFKSKYCSDDAPGGNPFRNSRVLEDDAGEWIQEVRFSSTDDTSSGQKLLCCPEDVIRCKTCTRKKQELCRKCKIPLCRECAACVVKKKTSSIPMVLANDNFWGYTTDLLFKYKVTWLEAAIVQPCWTSMLVCYVEGDGGHLLGEEVQHQQFRTRLRGTAHSFACPGKRFSKS